MDSMDRKAKLKKYVPFIKSQLKNGSDSEAWKRLLAVIESDRELTDKNIDKILVVLKNKCSELRQSKNQEDTKDEIPPSESFLKSYKIPKKKPTVCDENFHDSANFSSESILVESPPPVNTSEVPSLPDFNSTSSNLVNTSNSVLSALPLTSNEIAELKNAASLLKQKNEPKKLEVYNPYRNLRANWRTSSRKNSSAKKVSTILGIRRRSNFGKDIKGKLNFPRNEDQPDCTSRDNKSQTLSENDSSVSSKDLNASIIAHSENVTVSNKKQLKRGRKKGQKYSELERLHLDHQNSHHSRNIDKIWMSRSAKNKSTLKIRKVFKEIQDYDAIDSVSLGEREGPATSKKGKLEGMIDHSSEANLEVNQEKDFKSDKYWLGVFNIRECFVKLVHCSAYQKVKPKVVDLKIPEDSSKLINKPGRKLSLVIAEVKSLSKNLSEKS